MDDPNTRHLSQVELWAAHHIPSAELAALMDDLIATLASDQPMRAVRVVLRRDITNPAQASSSYSLVLNVMLDVARDAAALGGALGIGKLTATFMEEMAKDAWKAVRTRLAKLGERGRRDEQGLLYEPCTVIINGVRFYLRGEMSDEDLVRRLLKASDYLKELPDQAFGESAGPPEFGLEWDADSNSWEGPAYGPTYGLHLAGHATTQAEE